MAGGDYGQDNMDTIKTFDRGNMPTITPRMRGATEREIE